MVEPPSNSEDASPPAADAERVEPWWIDTRDGTAGRDSDKAAAKPTPSDAEGDGWTGAARLPTPGLGTDPLPPPPTSDPAAGAPPVDDLLAAAAVVDAPPECPADLQLAPAASPEPTPQPHGAHTLLEDLLPRGGPAHLGTAATFTDERMLRARKTPPRGGWRRVVHQLSRGRISPGPGRPELVERDLIARATTPIQGGRIIAVISRKGGVGKTTTTLMLGHTFASLRGDRVVALDGNPDAGSLGYRVRRENESTITDLLADADSISRYADLRNYTSQTPTRLEIVASDDDPHISQAIGRSEYQAAVEILERHYNMILLDTGTGILDSATQGILGVADAVVVVLAPSLDGARAASLTLDWLDENGFADLAAQSVAILNESRRGGLVEIERLEQHFASRCRAIVAIPWDSHLDAGAQTDITALKPATRDAYLELAAAVADGFTNTARRDPTSSR